MTDPTESDEGRELAAARAMGLRGRQYGTGGSSQRLPPPRCEYLAKPPGTAYLPVVTAVARSVALQPMTVDTIIYDAKPPQGTGQPVAILRYPVFPGGTGPLGPLPSDPSSFSLPVPFGTAICPTLAPYAAARCGRR
jgi:hypothetical protein